MEKKHILLISLSIILIIAFFAYNTITSSITVGAQLYFEEGSVLVNNQPIQETTQLKQGDLIETKEDGLATIILYESITVSLNPNTKITIEELTQQHPKLSQKGGETWNTFTSIVGVESYSISAGNSLATVRGTEFSLTEEKIITTEGEVEYRRDGETFRVRRDEVIELVANKPTKRPIQNVEREIIKRQRERTVRQLENLRTREIDKKPLIKKLVTKQLGIEEKEINSYLRDIDNSGEDLDTLIGESPIKTESLEKVARITKEIQKRKGTLRENDEQQRRPVETITPERQTETFTRDTAK